MLSMASTAFRVSLRISPLSSGAAQMSPYSHIQRVLERRLGKAYIEASRRPSVASITVP